MAETKQTDGPKPKQDYSELPQKPIALKKGIGGLVEPGGRKSQLSDTDLSATPVPKQKKKIAVKRRGAETEQWTLRGVSKTAREAATNVAREEGLKLNEWLERAIYQAISASPSHSEPEKPIMDALEDIRDRLERIEQQRGLLARIWEYLKTWAG